MPRVRRRPRTRAHRHPLVTALTNPACYPHAVGRVHVIETHISWVFLAGAYAYKVKKPVKLPFLDFRTLARRRHFCREELRLNRRLAPSLYLSVVPIGGSRARPRIGRRPALEYAVKMRRFDSTALLATEIDKGAAPRAAFTRFAERLAEFHGALPPIRSRTVAEEAATRALGNLAELSVYSPASQRSLLDLLAAWTRRELAELRPIFAQRASSGAARECHGDLHLGNLIWRNGAIEAFDALEFDAALREIDVVSEIAFVAMDLLAHDRAELAYAFLNRYLEVSGDYAGMHVLRFYLVYRALVRAKVQAIAQSQRARRGRGNRYLRTALALTAPRKPLLVVTHGFSGSGKTFVTDQLVGELPALRVRSDLERKRLHGMTALARSGSGIGTGLYTAADSERTYAALATTADTLLRHGFDAIVDAAFLRRRERLHFRQIAAANGAAFTILDCRAAPRMLRQRIVRRHQSGRDASEADLGILDQQLRTAEPLDTAELRAAVRVATDRPLRYAALARRLTRR